MGDVYLGAGRMAKSPRKQQGFHLFTGRCISGLFVGRSELKPGKSMRYSPRMDLRSIRRPERIETMWALPDAKSLAQSPVYS